MVFNQYVKIKYLINFSIMDGSEKQQIEFIDIESKYKIEDIPEIKFQSDFDISTYFKDNGIIKEEKYQNQCKSI